ncbi:MAG: deoxyribonuclease IV, partial [Staphylococcus lugdunensis]|nr:deoxyribonuclease IV [Staphylococcus lugdunensis]
DAFKDIPKILETPFVGEDKKNKKAPYKLEIEMLKAQQFDPQLKDKLLTQ